MLGQIKNPGGFVRAQEHRSEPARLKTLRMSEQESDDAGWLITLSDLTLLLLCFLVVWYVSHETKTATQVPPAAAPADGRRLKRVDDAHRSELGPGEWRDLRDEIETYVQQLGLRKEVITTAEHNEILISLIDSVPFDSGKVDLRPQALPVLEKVAAVALSRSSLLLEINGHTDDVPIANAKFPSNWELSSSRASRVARYLIEKGIHPARVAVQGYAFNRPRMPNSNPVNRRANRRVEIRLYQNAAVERAKTGMQKRPETSDPETRTR